jgi:hypothetical protein
MKSRFRTSIKRFAALLMFPVPCGKMPKMAWNADLSLGLEILSIDSRLLGGKSIAG